MGWIFDRKHDLPDFAKVQDLTRYPELMWLHRLELLPAIILATLCFLLAGWSGFVVGFLWSTVLVYHATFCINSLAHVKGSKRYVTGDDSRNNWILAVFTMGEGWHNNHHAYQASVRQGFKWWEIDPTYYLLKAISWTGLIWNLKTPPEQVLRNEQKLGAKVIDRAAEELLARFNAERIAAALAAALETPELSMLQETLARARDRTAELIEMLKTLPMPHIPSRDELMREATTMFAKTRSLDEIVDRAHDLLLASLGARLATPVEVKP
jgi:stearoyl-CoA desaturase (delta-9 desaturase)